MITLVVRRPGRKLLFSDSVGPLIGGQRPHPQRWRLQRLPGRHLGPHRHTDARASAAHRPPIGREVVNRLLATVPGQHVILFTDDEPAFYKALGFLPQHDGMSRAVGTWLNRT
jgi:hypothetical protein